MMQFHGVKRHVCLPVGGFAVMDLHIGNVVFNFLPELLATKFIS